MQRAVRMFTLGAAALTVLLGASQLWANPANPLNGTWELNVAKSKYDPGPGPKSQTRTYEVTGQTEKLSSEGVDSQGKPTAVKFTASYDGKDYPITGLPNADTISVKRIDDYTFETTQKKGRHGGEQRYPRDFQGRQDDHQYDRGDQRQRRGLQQHDGV